MREYAVVYEREPTGIWAAYAPDLPGLTITGDTLKEAERLIHQGIASHIAGLINDGLPVPEPMTQAAQIAVRV